MDINDHVVPPENLDFGLNDLLVLQLLEQGIERPVFRLPHHPGIHRLPRTKAFRQVAASSAAVFDDIQNRAERLEVQETYNAALARQITGYFLMLSFTELHAQRFIDVVIHGPRGNEHVYNHIVISRLITASFLSSLTALWSRSRWR
ncbi:protein of unknown function [Methylocaldum szegediense]|uniref:Uncharacterized protein n=1 Tax=Methylocaldum szegediense TaxID=73780 RepID=A0ABN8X079_9GAMM|nr:protein of unknown function [Methylocaldum szegediense]